MFFIASFDDIKKGKVTDVYFQRTLEILKAKGINKKVVMEVFAKSLPNDWPWAVLCGIEELSQLFEGIKVNINCLPEGTIFHAHEPVLAIEGKYTDFGHYETVLLGFLCQASGAATAAARCRKAAGDRSVLSFGARRMHPAIAPMIERSAFIGGCDGVAVVESARQIGEEPVGTMPHALILIMGDTLEATKAFDEIIPKEIKRISLVDTFNDEKIESLRIAEAMGDRLFGIRLDTPSSRRGNFLELIKEVRWELNLRGFNNIKIFVSGGIDEMKMHQLNPVVDGYGVGTYISNAPVIDFSCDIVEIDNQPIAKRGKKAGRKSLWRCPNCYEHQVLPRGTKASSCGCGSKPEEFLLPLINDGKIITHPSTARTIREYVLKQLPYFELKLGNQ
jgi:nicotinate phosphoribosyltransferase